MSPPKKEKAASPEAAPFQTYAADNVNATQAACNSKPLPPGFGFENGEPVPVTPPEAFTAEEKERIEVIGPVVEWACGSKSKLAALQYLGGLDTRTVAEIAKTHKISPSIVHREIGKLRAFIGGMR